MTDHPIVAEDETTNERLINGNNSTSDTGDAFTAYIRGLGYEPPEQPEVVKWGLCVIGDDDGQEWLACDAVSVDATTQRRHHG